MRNLPAFFVLVFFGLVALLFVSSAGIVSPADGSSTVNANVNNPSLTPTFTPTPTYFNYLSSTPTPTINPTLSPSLTPVPSISPTPIPLPSGVTPTPSGNPPSPGESLYLDISGFASPHASIIMTTDSVFLRAAVADSQGNFYISQVKVEEGFTDFCLENTDFQRIGDSLSCFKIPPVTSSTSRRNIFLPPSLGLSSQKTTPLTYFYAFGYTMPNSTVNLSISKKINLNTTARGNGYYSIKVSNLAVGTYELFATAQYQKKDSVKPSKTQEVKSLTPGEIVRENLITTITGFLVRFGWIAVPILILIFILLSKRLRDRLVTIARGIKNKGRAAPKGEGHLHHYWFVGY